VLRAMPVPSHGVGMEPGRKIISFYAGRLIGGSRVWYFVGSKAAFPTYYVMTEMWYSDHVRDLWPTGEGGPGTPARLPSVTQQLEPILRFYRRQPPAHGAPLPLETSVTE